MKQEKFEDLCRLLMIIIATFVCVFAMCLVVNFAYSSVQDNELTQLRKEESKLQTKVHEMELKKLMNQINSQQ